MINLFELILLKLAWFGIHESTALIAEIRYQITIIVLIAWHHFLKHVLKTNPTEIIFLTVNVDKYFDDKDRLKNVKHLFFYIINYCGYSFSREVIKNYNH